MPKVTQRIRYLNALMSVVLVFFAFSAAQSTEQRGPAATLYEQLRSVGLDSARVYKIREASLDRSPLHVSFNDGTIAFTEDVAGRITGAFFSGDGEVLLSPPNQIERSSMALFTGAAILEEKFATAYLRCNDDTLKELQPSLRPAENAKEFIAQWNGTARNLAGDDALRLLTTFSRLLPIKSGDPSTTDAGDRMLHLKVQGLKLGIIDLFFDNLAREQISAGQIKKVDSHSTYDVWTSFAVGKEKTTDTTSEIAGGEENQGDIEISNYKIKTEIKLPTELEAEANLHALVRRADAKTVLFELSRYLRIDAVTANGKPVEFIHNPSLEGTQLERRGDDLVAVLFPEPLQVGQQIDLRFTYRGPVLSDAGGGLLYVGARGTWYPNRGFSKAIFDLEFQYPAGWTLVATGDKREEGASSPALHMQTSRWISDRPIPVAGFNLGKYSHVTEHAGPVTLQIYAASGMERTFPKIEAEDIFPEPPVFPPHHEIPRVFASLPPSPAVNAQAVGRDAARALTFFAERFGPYPYRDLAVTQIPGEVSQGWPGLIFLSSFSFLSPAEKTAMHMSAVQQTISDGVIAHETAHQWWGDSVTWSGYRDQWIVEALANYSALMLLESTNPAKFRAVMDSYRDDLLHKNADGSRTMNAGPVTLGGRLNSSKFSEAYEIIAYERGTWLFHMLRTIMAGAQKNSPHVSGGSKAVASETAAEPFVLALRALRDRYQKKTISTEELIKIFEEFMPGPSGHEGKPPLEWFYRGWINGTGIPTLELHNARYVDKPSSTSVSGTIKQKDVSEDLITSIPIFAVLNGKTVFVSRIIADGPETQFHVMAPRGTKKIVIDPNHTVLSRSR